MLAQLTLYDQALEDCDRALALDPAFREGWLNRGHVLRELGRPQEAIAAYREAQRLGGGGDEAKFALAAMGEEEAPPIAPSHYIVGLFDGYAERFDRHLVGTLKYQAHERVCEALMSYAPPPGDVLDLGCGTGLCAPLLRPAARSMTGVDLSPRMLEVAGRRGIYTELVCADVADYVQRQQQPAFDMVVSTDVFIYLGDLRSVFEGVRKSLRPRGLFGFSIEAAGGVDFVLLPTRRYAQSPDYIRRLAGENDFEVLRLDPCVVRKEGNQDLPGYVAVLRAP